MKKLHSPYSGFKGWLRSKDLTYKDIATALGLSIATVSAKINGSSDFCLAEIKMLKQLYGLSNDVFF